MKNINVLHIILLFFINVAYGQSIEETNTSLSTIDSVIHFKHEQINSYKTNLEKRAVSKATIRHYDQKHWEKYLNKRNYQEKEKKESNTDFPEFEFKGLGWLGTFFKLLIYFCVVLAIGFALFKLFEAQFKKNKLIKKEQQFFIEELDQKIQEVDLYQILENYLLAKNFKSSIRVYYLIIIKELGKGNFIQWEKQKTNGIYLQEMLDHKLFKDFQDITQIYERIWFGKIDLDVLIFEQIELRFKNLIQNIKNSTSLDKK